MKLAGVSTNNLKNVTLEFPTAAITGVCGVSGSGKTSLIMHTLYPMLLDSLGIAAPDLDLEIKAKSLGPPRILEQFKEVLLVDQSPLGRSTRSNILTFLKLNDSFRKFFAKLPEAKALDLTPSSFSFNSPGGRCETCRGWGRLLRIYLF